MAGVLLRREITNHGRWDVRVLVESPRYLKVRNLAEAAGVGLSVPSCAVGIEAFEHGLGLHNSIRLTLQTSMT